MTELTTAGGTFVLAILVLNPFHLWMPTMLAMVLLAGLFLVFCVFALFVMRENGGDEREVLNRSFAGRAAFLAGAAVLVAALILQDLSHVPLDPWLVGALVAMLAVKVGARLYSDRYR